MAQGVLDFFSAHPRLKAVLRPAVRLYFRHGGVVRRAVGKHLWTAQFRLRHGRRGTAAWHFESDAAIGRSPARDQSVVMLGIADMRFDPRIEREARALASAGYRVIVMFPETATWKTAGVSWGEGITFEPVPARAGDYAYDPPGYNGDEFFHRASRHHPFAFHAHDLNTAFIGLALARRTGAHLVCDFHEWFSENVGFDMRRAAYVPHQPDLKRLYRWLEREALLYASQVITVCDSLADAMAAELGDGRRPAVIRNIPMLDAAPTIAYPPLKQQLGLDEATFAILYQGGTGETRLLEPVIAALQRAPRATLVIRGPFLDRYGEGYRALAAQLGVADRLILRPPVPSRDVVAAARGADAGLYTVANLCKNFYLALPNKVFEYMAAGLPVLSADFPEAKRLVEGHDVGLTFDAYDPASIAAAINRMIDDHEARERFRVNTAKALASIDAEREWSRLVDIYNALPQAGAEAA